MQGLGRLPELIARYDQRVPRYTSYPTAPRFRTDAMALIGFGTWAVGIAYTLNACAERHFRAL
ncbi:hypothetical protein [Microvirga sp. CF3016]|uniref:hypothetical protein n=1 Tax=Microvirga sp. CF3016 TaxID=3110181 RepID=UPI002E7A3E09|nr:hypothetical protein [Microvirga sp. CF3016]MEE1613286.1 hypothetical protein [Microvirga sp. CF3016]